MIRTILIVLAIVTALITAAIGFGWFDETGRWVGWLGLSLTLGWAAQLPYDTWHTHPPR